MKRIRFFLFLLCLPVQLLAVPAWSRLTGASCAACHSTPNWQLTPAGIDFLKNGHREARGKLDLAAQSWDKYLSLYGKFRAYGEQRKRPSTQLEQHSVSLYAGGPLSERLSFFAEYYLSENTGKTEVSKLTDGDGARKKLAEAFLQYNQPLPGGFLALRAGQILPGALHVFGVGARSIEQRALVLNEVLNPSNPYKPFNRQQGFDATLNMGAFEGAMGVVNGSAGTNSLDSDEHKDIYGSEIRSRLPASGPR